jgi:uncharacterized protein YbbC (DUF1343 family)
MVLIEGTNLTEGRGTTTPFELVGAPFIDPFKLADALDHWKLPGITYRPMAFKPTFQKWADRTCGGLFFHVLDDRIGRPYFTAVVLLACIRRLWPDQFQWLSPPYEYETQKMPIDILSGGSALRLGLEDLAKNACSTSHSPCETRLPQQVVDLTALDEDRWWAEVGPYMIYS